MPKSLLIIGGGVIGLCTAYYALQRGFQVTIIERGAPDHDSCSLGNAGMVTPSHFIPLAKPGMAALGLRMMLNPESPFTIRPRLDSKLFDWAMKFLQASTPDRVARSAPILRDLLMQSRGCFEEFAALPDFDFGFQQKGLLMLCKSEEAMREEKELAEYAHRLGIQAEILSPAEAAERDPSITMDIAGAVNFPQDSHLTPNRFIKKLTDLIVEKGCRFIWSTGVIGWRRKGDHIEAALTDKGEYSADEYLVTGGAWSPQILQSLGLKLPMQAGKGYSVDLPNPPQLPSLPSILTEARVAVTPMGSSLRFAGTMEIVGLDQSIDQNRVNGIFKSIPQYFPEFSKFDFKSLKVWSGLRPCSPDGLPYVGRLRNYSNLSVAAGHAMLGLSLGPITGRLMSEILSGGKTSIEIGLLSPARYR